MVEAVGKDVTQFKVGDPVCGLTNGGGYAEYCVVPETQTLIVPEGVSLVQAAAIPETFLRFGLTCFRWVKPKPGKLY